MIICFACSCYGCLGLLFAIRGHNRKFVLHLLFTYLGSLKLFAEGSSYKGLSMCVPCASGLFRALRKLYATELGVVCLLCFLFVAGTLVL